MYQNAVLALIDGLAGRAPKQPLESMRRTAACGEEGCALSELVALVVNRRVRITPLEGHEIRRCIDGMGMTEEVLHMLIGLREPPPKRRR